MGKGRVFRGFKEGPINFAPTYKFDPGTNSYDSSFAFFLFIIYIIYYYYYYYYSYYFDLFILIINIFYFY